LGIQMSQTNRREQGGAATTAKPKARRDWELFWRIVAGLMLVVIAWVIWVLYQISPRSVVTPLAFESRAKSTGMPQAATGGSAADASPLPLSPAPAVRPPRAAEAAAADLAMDQAQAAAHASAHQASADVQAVPSGQGPEKAPEKEPLKREGLKLSTEITTPLAGKKRIPEKQ
jgi:hypothetical protein